MKCLQVLQVGNFSSERVFELEELLVELEVTHRHLNLEVLLEVLLVELEEEDNFALTSRTTSRSAVVVKE